VTLSRSFKNRFSVEGGIADIDIAYVNNMGLNLYALELGLTVNGDQYGVGKRYFARPTIALTKYASLVGSYNHILNTDTNSDGEPLDIWNKQALTAGFVIDAKKLFFHSPAVH
jgi:nucleoside-specific outer membrane channel protein Tsx